jgi:hypothetical protein
MYHTLRAFMMKSTQSSAIKIVKVGLVDVQGTETRSLKLHLTLLSVKHEQPQIVRETNL